MIAVLLAAGVVAWSHVLHLGAARPGGHAGHITRDAALALPLALVATAVSRRPLLRAALFSALLIPGAVAHRAIDAAAAGAHDLAGAHAHGSPGWIPGMHEVADAARAFPVALAICVLAVVARRRQILTGPRRTMRVLAVASVTLITMLPVRAGAQLVPFTTAMPIPPERTGDDISIDMRAADVQILPGAPTSMWTYDGMFPGPTIRRPSGAPTRVTFTNSLPTAAGSATVHHHGGHQASSEDGQPHEHLIAPGTSRTYAYDLVEDGAPERGAFQWYHDHSMDVTGRNVWMGLAGMVILDDPAEASLPLPDGAYDVPIMLADRTFDAANQIDSTYSLNPAGTFGTVALANGAAQPFFTVADRRYRLRLLNASNARTWNLELSSGQAMTQISTESGLLPAPVTRTRLRLGPAERAEVVVDFAGRLGERIVLRNVTGSSGPSGVGTLNVLEFRVDTDVTSDPSSVPASLRPARDIAWTPPSRTRTWTLDANPLTGVWTINGAPYDPHRVDTAPLHPRLGDTERWIFVNDSPAEHVMHIHDVDWKVVARLGRGATDPAEAAAEQGAKETFLVRANEVVALDSRFTDHLGRYVLHCHVLEHEDRAMMAQFEVVP